jgi:two-component system LytT family response regulator
MIHCVVIEDEIASQEILTARLRSMYPEIQIDAMIGDKSEAVAYLKKNRVDLVFMDNHLVGGMGLQVLQESNLISTEVIFITAYSEYAIEALNNGATYYLLKPYNDSQFRESVDRALQRIGDRRRILMVGAKQDTMIHLDDVMYIESDGVYSVFHMVDGTKVISSRNLGVFESRLSPYNFYRIHHSVIVNVDHIATVEKGQNPSIRLKDGHTELSISQRKAKAFFDAFEF